MTQKEPTLEEKCQRGDRIRTAVLAAARERFQSIKHKHDKRSALLAPISPTPPEHISLVLAQLNLSAESLLLDLGCGDGRWLIRASQETNCQCVGCDVNAERLEVARSQVQLNGLTERIQLFQQDAIEFLRDSPFVLESNAIVIYLFREAMEKISDLLRQRFLLTTETTESREQPRQVQIVSIGFSLPHFTPVWHHIHGGVRVYIYDTSEGAKRSMNRTKTVVLDETRFGDPGCQMGI